MIQVSDCEYILVKQDDGDYFCAYDLNKRTYFEMGTRVGGGTCYHEPSATDCIIMPSDKIIN